MLLFEKYLAQTYIAAWSILLIISIFDLIAQSTQLIKDQSFLLEVIIIRTLISFQLISTLSKIKLIHKSYFKQIITVLYILLKLSLVMLYLQDNTDQYIAIPFILIFSINGLLNILLVNTQITTMIHNIINKISPKLPALIKYFILQPLTIYYGYKVMNNYIKRYAEDISYQEINLIRIQQLLISLWFFYSIKKGFKQLFNINNHDKQQLIRKSSLKSSIHKSKNKNYIQNDHHQENQEQKMNEQQINNQKTQ